MPKQTNDRIYENQTYIMVAKNRGCPNFSRKAFGLKERTTGYPPRDLPIVIKMEVKLSNKKG